LVLYVEERLEDGETDAQVFIARDGDFFKVFCTRAQGSSSTPVPVSRLAFKSVNGVLSFLKTLITWKHSNISVELHAVERYDSLGSFNDLWDISGKDTELGAWDNISFGKLRKCVKVLDKAAAETSFRWSARG
jgi:hypothetical protein